MVIYLGDGNNVVYFFIFGGVMMGMMVWVVILKNYEFLVEIV